MKTSTKTHLTWQRLTFIYVYIYIPIHSRSDRPLLKRKRDTERERGGEGEGGERERQRQRGREREKGGEREKETETEICHRIKESSQTTLQENDHATILSVRAQLQQRFSTYIIDQHRFAAAGCLQYTLGEL